MALIANIERARVQEWLGNLRLGGHTGARLRWAGNCTAPVEIFCRGLPDKICVSLLAEKEAASVATIETPCRKCEPCLRARSQLWAARARDEIAIATRTWFGTLTLAPAQALQLRFGAELQKDQQGHQLGELTEDELFTAMSKGATAELTKWLKRIRKNSGARLRYILVCEKHKSGVPHWHVLIHEYEGKVTKAKLEASWRYGFSHFRLVERENIKTAWYVCKYLGKSALARVRASQQYGTPKAATIADQIENQIAILMQGRRNAMTSVNKGNPTSNASLENSIFSTSF
jgi:hypothetical protein